MKVAPRTSSAGRVFGYGRVSTHDQTTQNQRQELMDKGYAIHARHWFADEGVSGKTPALQRPQFAAMLGKLDEGDTLVVSKLDRLGRDVIDVLSILEQLAAIDVRVKVLALGDVDLNSAAGRLTVGVLAVVARMERDMLIERTQAGLANARAQGKTLGRRPKTDDAQRQTIRGRLSEGVSVSEVARDYKVSRATIIAVRDTATA